MSASPEFCLILRYLFSISDFVGCKCLKSNKLKRLLFLKWLYIWECMDYVIICMQLELV